MATPRPKKFVAVRDFSYGSDSFAAGDEVPHGRVLRALLGHGDQFVTAESKTTPKTEEPTDG